MIPPTPLGTLSTVAVVDAIYETVNWEPDAAAVKRHAVAVRHGTLLPRSVGSPFQGVDVQDH